MKVISIDLDGSLQYAIAENADDYVYEECWQEACQWVNADYERRFLRILEQFRDALALRNRGIIFVSQDDDVLELELFHKV